MRAQREEIAMATVATTRDVYRDNLLPSGMGLASEGDTLEVQALFHGQLIGTRHLTESRGTGKKKVRAQYVIGAAANADAPVAPEMIGGEAMPLVTTWDQDYVVSVTPQMGGELWVDGRAVLLQDYVRERGRSFTLPPNCQARVDCGQVVFVLGRTPKAQQVPRRWFDLRWAEHKYTAGAGLVLGLFLFIMMAIPPDTRSLSLESFNWEKNYLAGLSIPAAEKDPAWLTQQKTNGQGNEGKPAAGEAGKMGDKKSTATNKRYGIKGPANNQDPHMSKQQAAAQAANSGILGVLSRQGSSVSSIFGRETALGNDPEDALGNLIGVQIGNSAGLGGLSMYGTGAGGGGTGENTIGFGQLNRMGTLGRGAGGDGTYGQHVGALIPTRRPKVPEVFPGTAVVRGSLDKEIIRRVVRLHMNEVKYCYDQELVKQPALAGRISVQFAISGTGQVLSSVLQTSSMANARVESCVVNATRRWDFPKPVGGGVVIVVYPFTFASPTS
ncbi:MAG TPA: AgmX/PglI C-terminal domain-containing protein [Polyangia bacterium]